MNEQKPTTTPILLISIGMLSFVDFILTYYVIEYMGGGETNPVLAYLIGLTGSIWVILWFKILTISAIVLPYIYSIKFWAKCQTKGVIWTLLAMILIYSMVVLSTFYRIVFYF